MKSLWILCQPRSGSTYLCDILNNLNIFPIFNDSRLKSLGPIKKNSAFNEWLRIYLNKKDFEQNPPLNLKCLYEQYWSLFGSNENSNYIKKIIPNVKFIWLKRKNLIEHTASLYYAIKTKKYHITNSQNLKEYSNIELEFDKDFALKVFNTIKAEQNIWDYFLQNNYCQIMYYEDLINNPAREIENLLNNLEIEKKEIKIKTSFLKMNNNSKKEFCKKLENLI